MCRRAFFVLPSEAMGQTTSAENAEHFSRLTAGRSYAKPPDAGGAVEGAWNRSPRGDQGLRAGVDPDLPGQDRQDAVPGSAPGARRDAAAPLILRGPWFLPTLRSGDSEKGLFSSSDFATGAARRGGFRLLGRRLGRLLALRLGDARLERLHQVDHRRLLLDRLRRRDLLAGELRLQQRLQIASVAADELLRI